MKRPSRATALRIEMNFRMMLAIGAVAARYDVSYGDYRLAEVTTRIRP